MDRLVLAFVVVFGVPAATVLYAWLIERLLSALPTGINRRLRPWLWLLPALVLLTFFLIYPTINTIILSFRDARGINWVGLDNFRYTFTNPAMLTAFRNNFLWLLAYPTITLALALAIAVLADRVKYESMVKAVVFIPMAISYVAAGVIWKLMYDYQPAARAQTGLLNALGDALIPGFAPIPWLNIAPINNFALIFIGIWMYTGFATVILSAGLKSIPVDMLDAARIDGANEFNIFRHITLPLLASTIAVVATTMIISVLKIFDVIYVMTSGNFGTEVIAVRMFKELFTFRHIGRASTISTMLLLLTLPVMLYNIRRFRAQEELR
jgi:alpha-glucoside transport system permease protein